MWEILPLLSAVVSGAVVGSVGYCLFYSACQFACLWSGQTIPAFPVSEWSCRALSTWSGHTNCEINADHGQLLHSSEFLGSCVSGPPGWWGWAAAAFPKIQLFQDLTRQQVLDSHRERRMGGSIPAFDMHLPREMGIGRSKVFHLIGMISRDVGKVAPRVMWSSVLLPYLQNPKPSAVPQLLQAREEKPRAFVQGWCLIPHAGISTGQDLGDLKNGNEECISYRKAK